MIEDVEAMSAQLSVTILMIWKPVIKSIHSFKIRAQTQTSSSHELKYNEKHLTNWEIVPNLLSYFKFSIKWPFIWTLSISKEPE